MTLDAYPLVLIVAGLTAYAVLGGADFGAGFWSLVAGRPGRDADVAARPRAPRDGPRVGGEPRLADLRARRLLDRLPDGVRVDHVDARRAALHRGGRDHPARRPRTRCAWAPARATELRAVDLVFALSSILTPFAFGAAIGGIASGRVPVGNAAGDPFSSWLNPTSVLVGVLAVAVAAYLAAVYLAADAKRLELRRPGRGVPAAGAR